MKFDISSTTRTSKFVRWHPYQVRCCFIWSETCTVAFLEEEDFWKGQNLNTSSLNEISIIMFKVL